MNTNKHRQDIFNSLAKPNLMNFSIILFFFSLLILNTNSPIRHLLLPISIFTFAYALIRVSKNVFLMHKRQKISSIEIKSLATIEDQSIILIKILGSNAICSYLLFFGVSISVYMRFLNQNTFWFNFFLICLAIILPGYYFYNNHKLKCSRSEW